MSDAAREELLRDGTVTVAGAVREYQVSRSVLYEWMGDGRLVYCQAGRKRLIPRRALARLMAANLVGGTALPTRE
jgi:excisionase family DNA binding protein